MSFPPANEMFQFAGFASHGYLFTMRYRKSGGLPHSEIPGSKPARSSPGLIATCYVLHRLYTPRHPPNALLALDTSAPVMHRKQPAHIRPHQYKVPHIKPCYPSDTIPSNAQAPRGLPSHKLGHAVALAKALTHFGTRTTKCPLPAYRKQAPTRANAPWNQSDPKVNKTSRINLFTMSKTGYNKTNKPNPPKMVELNGIEPMTSCLQSRRSPN